MKNQLTPEQILFELFKQSVKSKDKMQFNYYCLYSAIANADNLTSNLQDSKKEESMLL